MAWKGEESQAEKAILLGSKESKGSSLQHAPKSTAGLAAWQGATLKVIWESWQKISQTQRRFTPTLTCDMVVTAPGRLDVSF